MLSLKVRWCCTVDKKLELLATDVKGRWKGGPNISTLQLINMQRVSLDSNFTLQMAPCLNQLGEPGLRVLQPPSQLLRHLLHRPHLDQQPVRGKKESRHQLIKRQSAAPSRSSAHGMCEASRERRKLNKQSIALRLLSLESPHTHAFVRWSPKRLWRRPKEVSNHRHLNALFGHGRICKRDKKNKTWVFVCFSDETARVALAGKKGEQDQKQFHYINALEPISVAH
jgi:hypothetical protein